MLVDEKKISHLPLLFVHQQLYIITSLLSVSPETKHLFSPINAQGTYGNCLSREIHGDGAEVPQTNQNRLIVIKRVWLL